jgi:tetratricopeptide (TPR) repeat protein
MDGDIQSTPRADTCRVLEHLLGEAAEVLFGPPRPAPQRKERARGLSPHLDAMASFRLADRQLGGGHVYDSLLIYLRTDVAPSLIGLGTVHGAETFRDAAVLTEMAGWMAHDSGRDSVAQGHLLSALGFGQAAADPTVTANVEASMSHLALQRGDADQAVDLARSGLERLRSTEAVPVLASRLHAMKARALARLGYGKQAQHSLDAARDELAAADTAFIPDWVAPFDYAALASEAASTLLELRELPTAIEEANRALELRDASRARSRCLGQITLAHALIAHDQVEAACCVTHDLLGTCQSLGSVRISQQLAALQTALESYAGSRWVKEVLDRMTVVAQHRRLLLASLTVTEGSQV